LIDAYVKGFTLLEQLICLFIIGIVVFFVFPGITSLYKKNQLQTVTAEITNAVHTGKLQALVTGETLVLTPLPSSNDWSDGMVLFVDNREHKYREDSRLLYAWKWTFPGVKISWQGMMSNNYLLFAIDMKSSMTNGYFMISNAKQQVKLSVNRLARVR